MHTLQYTNAQYEELARCPFCDGVGLAPNFWDADDCPHFVVAFQEGDWDPQLISPAFCNGFRYQRKRLMEELTRAPGIVRKLKPISEWHPRIEAYFCLDQGKAAELREQFQRDIITGAKCGTCGNDTAVVLDEEDEIVCAICGSHADPTTPTL